MKNKGIEKVPQFDDDDECGFFPNVTPEMIEQCKPKLNFNPKLGDILIYGTGGSIDCSKFSFSISDYLSHVKS